MVHNFANKELAFILSIRLRTENSSPSNYHLFPALKQNLGCEKFKDDSETERVVTWWLITEDTDFYQQRTDKLAPQCDKCVSCGGDYVEK
jgi:hypothetical protein